MATIHQRVSGWLWNWSTGPGWVRNGSEMARLANAGMKVLKVQLQDNGEIPRELADEWRAAGLKVWGAVGHVDGRAPEDVARYLKDEQKRLALAGVDCNFEEDVRAMDAASGGKWSERFCTEFRRLLPKLPAHIDSYYGSAAATPGINLGAFHRKSFRLCLQSYWGNEGLWDDPCTRMVQWTSGASPAWPKAKVKPLHRVSPNSAGQLPDWSVVFNDHLASGCLGVGWYYIDGGAFDLIEWLTKEAVRRGVAL